MGASAGVQEGPDGSETRTRRSQAPAAGCAPTAPGARPIGTRLKVALALHKAEKPAEVAGLIRAQTPVGEPERTESLHIPGVNKCRQGDSGAVWELLKDGDPRIEARHRCESAKK